MSRNLTTAAQIESEAPFHTLILLAKFEFGDADAGGNEYQAWRGAVEPAESGASGNELQLYRGAVEPSADSGSVYVHSGIGSITFDGNNYTGVGNLGNIGEARESEQLGPLSIEVTLNALVSDYLEAALDAGKYGDPVTIYAAYRQADGTLVSDPWVVWSGWYEFAQIKAGNENIISMTLQHDLSVLEEKDGSRFTDEDHQGKYAGDLAFEFVHEAATQKLVWGGRTIQYGRTNDTPAAPGYQTP